MRWSSTVTDPAARTHRAATIAGVVLAILKAAVANERTPVWDFDPWVRAAPMTGIGPATGVAIDASIVLCAVVAVWAASLRGHAVRTGWIVLASVGAIGVAVVHGDIETFAPEAGGAAWLAGIAAVVACAHAPRDRWLFRVVVGLTLGFVGMLLAKGLVQVFVEHPATVRSYRAEREAILAARGWAADSASARSFERRLLQPEATGWFGLANVYASFAAAAAVGFGAAAAAWAARTRAAVRDRAWQATALGCACGCAGLWLSGSKGGLGAAAVAAAGVVAVRTVRRRGVARWIGPALIGAVLVGIATRGAIGTGVGELSLLFRAFYAEGALRIIAGHPIAGVGPGGFQDAYLLAKPAISPEAVASPHSVLLDWLSMLGVFGAGWCALLLLAARDTGVGLRTRSVRTPTSVVSWKALLLLAGLVVLSGAFAERFATTPEVALGRLGGLGLWVVLAAAVANGLPVFAVRLAAGGAGLAMLVHTQIELTAVQAESAALALGMIGLAAGPAPGGSGGVRRIRSVGARLVLAAPAAALVVVIAGAVPRLAAWQGLLLDAAADVTPIGATAAGNVAGPGGLVGPDEASVVSAADRLGRAAGVRPAHEPTSKALGRTLGSLASGRRGVGDEAGAGSALLAAVDSARRLAEASGSASAYGWLGNTALQAGRSGVLERSAASGLVEEGLAALEQAATLDPHGVTPAARLMRALSDLGRPDAAVWAREALMRDALSGLDPLVGLSDGDRRAARRLAE